MLISCDILRYRANTFVQDSMKSLSKLQLVVVLLTMLIGCQMAGS
jgi:hypothetical protein